MFYCEKKPSSSLCPWLLHLSASSASLRTAQFKVKFHCHRNWALLPTLFFLPSKEPAVAVKGQRSSQVQTKNTVCRHVQAQPVTDDPNSSTWDHLHIKPFFSRTPEQTKMDVTNVTFQLDSMYRNNSCTSLI
ncbi:Allergen Fus c 3 [Fusarium oxysporum f. sp. albedinis]|nr:Allergen Fus c 3 [Fusarium oxysporum f. sp. albedinis]